MDGRSHRAARDSRPADPFHCTLRTLGREYVHSRLYCGRGVADRVPGDRRASLEFTEGFGQIFNYFVFFFLGLVTSQSWNLFEPDLLVYAVLSLTVVRMLPVAVALIGTRLKKSTVLFMDGSARGPCFDCTRPGVHRAGREPSGEMTIRAAVILTVLISVFAHG